MSQTLPNYAKRDLAMTVARALEEDIGSGDITAQLIPANEQAKARVITREQAVICGRPWVDEVFRQIDPSIKIDWQVKEGELVQADQVLYNLQGNARNLLTGERAALNFLQLLSGTATICKHYADKVADTQVKLLDTRKTIPCLRNAQKYAVTKGGCYNHRIGLYDAFLIKENHIAACGGIENTIKTAKQQQPNKPIEVEVESMEELQQALNAGADIIMLDNFSYKQMRDSVALVQNRAKLEASGNIDEHTLVRTAETGVDFISIGGLTKHCQAVDLSMRFF